jgi:hypothetical protein
MLLRKDGLDVIAIPQPCHAWLSGQMARAWGNEHFAAPMPYDEVCLAAGKDDIGWLDWETTPALDAGPASRRSSFVCRRRSTLHSGAKVCAVPRIWAQPSALGLASR